MSKSYVKSMDNKENANTEVHNSTREQVETKNVSKPIPKEKAESYGQKTKHLPKYKNSDFSNANSLYDVFIRWIKDDIAPTHFLTIRLPENIKSYSYENSLEHLQFIMKIFEKRLLGRYWHKKHLPFISFAERGISNYWHFHILFNKKQFSDDDLDKVMELVKIQNNFSDYCLHLMKINSHEDKVISYCTKEIKVYRNNQFDGDRFISSYELFNLSPK